MMALGECKSLKARPRKGPVPSPQEGHFDTPKKAKPASADLL